MLQSENFSDHIGQEVTIEGIALRSKAGAFIVSGEQDIWLQNYDWNDEEYEKKVQVTGILSQGSDPLQTFPAATQDEDGAWSQGVGGIESMELKPIISSSSSWIIQVQQVSLVEN